MNTYRYQLERYRGRGTRYSCPQCGRKYCFTRYIDTENNNQYINEKVGKCNRLDKCGYHYTPREYFTDNPWLRDNSCLFVRNHRKTNKQTNEQPVQESPKPACSLPRWLMERTLGKECDYKVWLRVIFFIVCETNMTYLAYIVRYIGIEVVRIDRFLCVN